MKTGSVLLWQPTSSTDRLQQSCSVLGTSGLKVCKSPTQSTYSMVSSETLYTSCSQGWNIMYPLVSSETFTYLFSSRVKHFIPFSLRLKLHMWYGVCSGIYKTAFKIVFQWTSRYEVLGVNDYIYQVTGKVVCFHLFLWPEMFDIFRNIHFLLSKVWYAVKTVLFLL